MTDLDRDGAADEDRLPWLEPVDEEDVPEGGVAAGKLIGALIAALVAIGLIVGGGFWLRQRGPETASAEPATIAAPADPYKVKPAQPGGMQVPGQGDATYTASQGADPNAQIDLNAVAEAPLKAPAPPVPALPRTVPAPAPATLAKSPPPVAPAPVKAAPVKTAPVETAVAKPRGPQVQLGAFSSEAKADAAWKQLSGHYAFLGSAEKQVVSAKVGSGTVYRLRASGAGPDACAKLKAGGATCIAVGK